MSYCGIIGAIVETRRNDTDFSCEWKIPDFFSLTSEPGCRYGSPSFFFRNSEFSLALHPNGTTKNSKLGWITLFLFRYDEGPPKTFDVTVGIKGAEVVEREKEKRQEFSHNDRACCWFAVSTRSEFRKHRSRLLPDNRLIITCNIKSVVIPAARDASSQTEGIFNEVEILTEENKSPEKLGIEKLSEDIGKLLAADEHSDVTVQVGDVEFKVHRLILSARSPVLSAMFQHETVENVSNRISINDCKPDIFRDFLYYLYSGTTKTLTEQNVFDLYRVADKYLADDLKQLCLEHARNTLSVQTFCEAMNLALTHGESGLLDLVIEFAAENISLILCSVEWQNFIREYPTEANEILIKCFGTRSQKSVR